ncbi:run and fyve domain-containing protein 1-like [Stylonychia lemnae]|uniref:Run and fyve domain-containing protein 1-like n=1 Tax=Stylonychia lemnae TaxID=5949 RepID=A0A078B188_STYLE|nr:run and fyve domain-containing protein 1-like [Stylonychia lemnae]|eukprot:CDW87122.1 run and fyve domain-containing protein 1-like [Stylonychia lemnae]
MYSQDPRLNLSSNDNQFIQVNQPYSLFHPTEQHSQLDSKTSYHRNNLYPQYNHQYKHSMFSNQPLLNAIDQSSQQSSKNINQQLNNISVKDIEQDLTIASPKQEQQQPQADKQIEVKTFELKTKLRELLSRSNSEYSLASMTNENYQKFLDQNMLLNGQNQPSTDQNERPNSINSQQNNRILRSSTQNTAYLDKYASQPDIQQFTQQRPIEKIYSDKNILNSVNAVDAFTHRLSDERDFLSRKDSEREYSPLPRDGFFRSIVNFPGGLINNQNNNKFVPEQKMSNNYQPQLHQQSTATNIVSTNNNTNPIDSMSQQEFDQMNLNMVNSNVTKQQQQEYNEQYMNGTSANILHHSHSQMNQSQSPFGAQKNMQQLGFGQSSQSIMPLMSNQQSNMSATAGGYQSYSNYQDDKYNDQMLGTPQQRYMYQQNYNESYGMPRDFMPQNGYYPRGGMMFDMFELERAMHENQRLMRENKELREQMMSQRKEFETGKVNQMIKLGNLENEVNQSISKNNVLKGKIKKIKKFMLALSKIMEDSQVQDQGQKDDQNKQNQGFQNKGVDNDTDSDNEKLPTLELLCHQVKRLMTEMLEVKMKKLRANRRSYHKQYTKSLYNFNADGDYGMNEDEFNIPNSRAKSMPAQDRNFQDQQVKLQIQESSLGKKNVSKLSTTKQSTPPNRKQSEGNGRTENQNKRSSSYNAAGNQAISDRASNQLAQDAKSIDSVRRQDQRSENQRSTKKIQDGNKPMMWVPNDISEECALCKSYFNLFRRRHHCRMCGSLVCYYCSNHQEYVPGYADARVKVCDACYRDKKRLNRIKSRRWSIISGHFASNNY